MRHQVKGTPTATSTPTPTSTPFLNLNAEDSVSPVTCNGKGKPVAPGPFLKPPYHGWTSIVSYVDHDSPNYYQDGLIITNTGAEASPDPEHHGSGFPAYWSPSLRQYLYYDGHNGYDFDISYEPVYAAASGKVIFASWEYPTMQDHGYGRMVMISHRHGYVTLYGHFSRILVHKGEHVHQGQKIGISGNTGHSTGPHLHFTVFHNCTPVDPYGWNGEGPDPLISYQGEASTYLWRQQPLVANPAPGWPDLSKLPGAPDGRILLLRLPVATDGTSIFTHRLRSLSEAVVAAVRDDGGSARIDTVNGAVDVTGSIPPGRLLAIPGVVSITTTDTIEGEKGDVLHALARAGLADRQRRLTLDGARRWTGRFMRWQGRVLLVGKGVKNSSVTLHLGDGHGGAGQTVHTDPKTGAYAIDLGRMSARQLLTLERSLTAHHHRSVVSTATATPQAGPPTHAALGAGHGGQNDGAQPFLAALGLALLALAGLAAWYRPWSRTQ